MTAEVVCDWILWILAAGYGFIIGFAVGERRSHRKRDAKGRYIK